MVELPEALVLDTNIGFSELGFYAALMPFCSATRVCDLGIRGIAEAIGLHMSLVTRKIRRLEAAGWIKTWRERVESSRGQPRVMVQLNIENHQARPRAVASERDGDDSWALLGMEISHLARKAGISSIEALHIWKAGIEALKALRKMGCQSKSHQGSGS